MSKKILLIEDEKEFAEMVGIRLKQEGFIIDLAHDGEAGIKKTEEFKPDLIIMDIKLPTIDGYRVCELLKADDNYKSIPIVMLTARREEIEKKAGIAAGADEYLVKPCEPDVLLGKIKGLLK